MRKNMVKERLRRGEPCIGTWVDTGNPLAAEILAEAGYHWLAVDMEHNAIDLEDVLHCFYAMTTHDTVPFVRVPWNDPQILKRVLDIGAYGVFVPEIHGLEDAEAALRACRYAPQGARGVGGVRGRVYGGEDYHERANEEVAVVLMVEDIAMVRQLDQICRLPGLDGLFIGPQDLAASLGLSQLGYDNPDPDHRDAVNKVRQSRPRPQGRRQQGTGNRQTVRSVGGYPLREHRRDQPADRGRIPVDHLSERRSIPLCRRPRDPRSDQAACQDAVMMCRVPCPLSRDT
jgi:4-hydroxy-2-oxoheptanedioate aldolase